MIDILFAEDDPNIREWTALALEEKGRKVRAVADGAEAMKAYLAKRPDLVILDVMMPKISGWDVLAEIRRRDKTVPVMMLTAKTAEADKVAGLEGGADDYLGKPFGLDELRARAGALLRRSAYASAPGRSGGAQPLSIGPAEVDLARSAVVLPGGAETELTRLEAGILAVLAAHRGETVSRDILLDAVWGSGYTGTVRTLDTRIGSLRQKLGPAGAFIESVYGSGYRMKQTL